MDETQQPYKPTYQWVEARETALSDIREERRKQLEKWGIRVGMDHGTQLKILVEEVGEVAEAMLENDVVGLRKECVQVGAVAAAMIQMIDEGEA